MTFDATLASLFEDEITIESFSSETAARVPSYGASVTYQALIERGARRIVGRDGRDVVSNVSVLIPQRLNIDQRSRVTLPADFVPRQPPILGVEPLRGLSMDHTRLLL